MVFPNKKRDFSNYLQDQDQEQQPLKRKAPFSFLPALPGAELWSPQSLSFIEACLIRPVVRDVVERQVKAYVDLPRSSSSSKQVRDRNEEDELIGAGSGTTKLRLRLVNKISSINFTNSQIEAEDGQPLQVALWDTTTNSYYKVEETNPLSSAEIEFVVLDGEFGSARGDQDLEIHWSKAEFNKNILAQRKGDRPLLVGDDKKTRLKIGRAFINDLTFTANSSRNRTKKIQLGVRIIEPEILNNYPRIGEAVSNPVRVKDHRGEGIKKNHPPKGEDKVYRLEGIGKDRSTRLATKGIRTVDDFVEAYQRDPHSLRKWLGQRVSDKQWNEMVNHASEYVPLIPTFDPNSQLNNQTIINPTSCDNSYNGVGDFFFGQIEDNLHLLHQGLLNIPLTVGEASTSNTHHHEGENSYPLNQHFQESWPRT